MCKYKLLGFEQSHILQRLYLFIYFNKYFNWFRYMSVVGMMRWSEFAKHEELLADRNITMSLELH